MSLIYTYARLRGEGEKESHARNRKRKLLKEMKRQGVSEAQIIRQLIDEL